MPANPGLVAVGSDYVVFPGKRMGIYAAECSLLASGTRDRSYLNLLAIYFAARQEASAPNVYLFQYTRNVHASGAIPFKATTTNTETIFRIVSVY